MCFHEEKKIHIRCVGRGGEKSKKNKQKFCEAASKNLSTFNALFFIFLCFSFSSWRFYYLFSFIILNLVVGRFGGSLGPNCWTLLLRSSLSLCSFGLRLKFFFYIVSSQRPFFCWNILIILLEFFSFYFLLLLVVELCGVFDVDLFSLLTDKVKC